MHTSNGTTFEKSPSRTSTVNSVPLITQSNNTVSTPTAAKDARAITIIIDSSHSCMTGCFARSDHTAQLGTFCEDTVSTPTATKEATARTLFIDSSHSCMTGCFTKSDYTIVLHAVSTNPRL